MIHFISVSAHPRRIRNELTRVNQKAGIKHEVTGKRALGITNMESRLEISGLRLECHLLYYCYMLSCKEQWYWDL